MTAKTKSTLVPPDGLAGWQGSATAHGIMVPNADELTSYLAEHDLLAQVVPSIIADVRQAFGPNVELSLEVYKDPEVEDRYLTLYVRMREYESSILDVLQAVSERFNDKLEDVSGYFLLTTDFARPRGIHAV